MVALKKEAAMEHLARAEDRRCTDRSGRSAAVLAVVDAAAVVAL